MSTKMAKVDPSAVRAGDVMRIGENEFPVTARDCGWISVITHEGRVGEWWRFWDSLGATFHREVEEHPHGAIPDTGGAIIRIKSTPTITAEYSADDNMWSDTSYGEWATSQLQEEADAAGFDVLWPRPRITDDLVDECVDLYLEHDGTALGAMRVALEYAIGGRK